MFDGCSVIVTGGAGGLGAAAARRLHQAGAAIVIADLDDNRAALLADELGERIQYVRTDVLDEESVQSAIAAAVALGTFRYAVAAHGGFGVAERILKRDGSPASYSGFTKTIDLYLNGTYNVVRLAAAAIANSQPDSRGERGAIVTTASIAGYEGQVGQSAYSAAKAGVIGLTLVGARDLSPASIRLNCIAPGTMRTPIMEGVGDEALAKFSAAVPFPKRLGSPAEYASLVEHLLSNGYLNGEVIRLDGAQRFSMS